MTQTQEPKAASNMWDSRFLKLAEHVIHAEHNAILFANRSLVGCTLYVAPMMPCVRCATVIIQTGIKRVVSTGPSKKLLERWGADMELTKEMFDEVGIEFIETF